MYAQTILHTCGTIYKPKFAFRAGNRSPSPLSVSRRSSHVARVTLYSPTRAIRSLSRTITQISSTLVTQIFALVAKRQSPCARMVSPPIAHLVAGIHSREHDAQ